MHSTHAPENTLGLAWGDWDSDGDLELAVANAGANRVYDNLAGGLDSISGAVVGALIIGLVLGLMGSGGSILTLPVLVYLLGHQDKIAVAESLAIVGGIAAVAVIPYARERLVDWRCVLFFGLPGMLGTFLGAWLSKFVPGTFQLVLFGVLMLAAAVTFNAGATSPPQQRSSRPPRAPTTCSRVAPTSTAVRRRTREMSRWIVS